MTHNYFTNEPSLPFCNSTKTNTKYWLKRIWLNSLTSIIVNITWTFDSHGQHYCKLSFLDVLTKILNPLTRADDIRIAFNLWVASCIAVFNGFSSALCQEKHINHFKQEKRRAFSQQMYLSYFWNAMASNITFLHEGPIRLLIFCAYRHDLWVFKTTFLKQISKAFV